MILFEWDDNKNLINIQKHGISFEVAKSVFYDYDAILLYDQKHSNEEDRFLLIGLDKTATVLVVVHCYRVYFDNQDNEIIRIISARKATANEEKDYWKGIK